jgi:hypothetical protein
MSQPEPNFYPNIDRVVYESWYACNQSSLKILKRSAAHANYERTHPKEPSDEKILGQLIHYAVLQPALFVKNFVGMPLNPDTGKEYNRSTIKGMDAWLELEAKNVGKKVIKAAWWSTCMEIRQAVWLKPRIAELLSGKGTNEIGIVWRDPATGVLCKGLIDRLTRDKGKVVIIDLKSTTDASEYGFPNEIAKFDYQIQAAFYSDGLAALQPAERDFLFIAVEKEGPWESKAHRCAPSVIEQGQIDYRELLELWQECEASQTWPGYSGEVEDVFLPDWKYKEAQRARRT